MKERPIPLLFDGTHFDSQLLELNSCAIIKWQSKEYGYQDFSYLIYK